MSSAKKSAPIQICVKVDASLVARLDKLVPKISGLLGISAGRADVMRAALIFGVEKLERDSRDR
jgi:hypothetical protein